MVLNKTPVDECPKCGEKAFDHIKPEEKYEGDPIDKIRVCVTEKGAYFHSYKQIG